MLHGGTIIHIRGRASISGDDAHDLRLSEERAQSVRSFILRNYPDLASRITIDWVGRHEPLGDATSPQDMARDRSVHVTVVVPGTPSIPDEERARIWSRACDILQSMVGPIIPCNPDQLWTPLGGGIWRIIPRIPLFEDDLPSYYGSMVPSLPLCRSRPASNCMPQGLDSVAILGRRLESRYRLDRGLTDGMICQVVTEFLDDARTAIATRHRRLRSISGSGGSSTVVEDLQAYTQAEREWFTDGDPTCIWRYIDIENTCRAIN